jgi:hypothetical protein
MEDEKPSTKRLALRPKVIIPTDTVARPGDGTAISVQLMHEQNRVGDQKAAERRKKGDPFLPASEASEPALAPVFKPKDISPMDQPSYPGDEEAVHVHDILLENRIAEDLSGWGRLKSWTKRKSRRDRDFIVGVGGMDLAIIIMMRVMPGETTLVFGLSAITLFTTMAAWIMYMVMDDY